MQHAHTTPSTPWRWRVILGCQAVLLMTSGAPGTAWGACMWRWSSPVACAGARLSSPLRSPWSSSSRPLPSLPTQLPRHRDRLWWLPPGTRVHTRGAPLPLSPSALTAGARSPRRSPLSHRRARRTHRPEQYALACRPRAGPWGQGGLGHPGSPPAPSRGRARSGRRDGSHHHPSLPCVVTLPPARSRAPATADGAGVIRTNRAMTLFTSVYTYVSRVRSVEVLQYHCMVYRASQHHAAASPHDCFSKCWRARQVGTC